MPTYHKIRWRESDIKEMKRVVRNFNSKISRLTKQDPLMVLILPDKISIKELKRLIYTRGDYKRELNALKRFSMRGAEEVVEAPNNEYGLKLTKWQRTEILRRIPFINKRRKERLDELKNIKLKSRGESLGYTLSDIGMGNIDLVTFKPVNPFTSYMNRADLKMKWYFIRKESRSNYFNERDYALRESFIRNLLENYSESDIKDVIETIRQMDIKDFITKFREEGNTMEQAYIPNKEQYGANLRGLKATWLPKKRP